MSRSDVMSRTGIEYSTAAAFVPQRRPTAVVVLGGLAVLLYGVSFALPALDRVPGYLAFVYAVLFVFCLPMWVANPVFWFGLARLSQGRYRSAGKAGLVALLLALSESWMFHGELAAGYFVWASSMAVLAAVGLFGEEEDRPRRWASLPDWRLSGEAARIASRFRR